VVRLTGEGNATLGFFGPYQRQRDLKLADLRRQQGALWDAEQVKSTPPAEDGAPKPAPRIKDVIGAALDKIGSYNQLDNKQQKVALIDDVSWEIKKP